ncbi:MAG: 5,6-dimethylbenzimidazole synthase [Thermodesulfobacteriota bacterium]
MTLKTNTIKAGEFEGSQKEGLYRAIYSRRDIRSQFLDEPIPEEVLSRVLKAAHHAPSVGFMQPWNFILVRDFNKRKLVHEAFKRANAEATLMFSEDKREKYKGFKLEGILEAPLNICVTCDKDRFGPVVIGRTAQPIMDVFSSVCAVQNLWLAARAEGLGVGWVSIVQTRDLKEILSMPNKIVPIAYLCIGYVSHFPEKPELESAGWLPRLPLEDLVFSDNWEVDCKDGWPELHSAIVSERDHPEK